MLLRHATPRRNLRSILKAGLLCSKSQGRLPVVYLHAPSASSWALLHTVKRHRVRAQDVVILVVRVPRRWLRRRSRRLWYSRQDIPARRIVRVVEFAEIAEGAKEA